MEHYRGCSHISSLDEKKKEATKRAKQAFSEVAKVIKRAKNEFDIKRKHKNSKGLFSSLQEINHRCLISASFWLLDDELGLLSIQNYIRLINGQITMKVYDHAQSHTE